MRGRSISMERIPMQHRGLLPGALALIVLLLAACSPFSAAKPSPQPLPSPSAGWVLRLTQSGGIAGVPLSVEISNDGKLVAENQRSGLRVEQQLSSEDMSALLDLYAAMAMG